MKPANKRLCYIQCFCWSFHRTRAQTTLASKEASSQKLRITSNKISDFEYFKVFTVVTRFNAQGAKFNV